VFFLFFVLFVVEFSFACGAIRFDFFADFVLFRFDQAGRERGTFLFTELDAIFRLSSATAWASSRALALFGIKFGDFLGFPDSLVQ